MMKWKRAKMKKLTKTQAEKLRRTENKLRKATEEALEILREFKELEKTKKGGQ